MASVLELRVNENAEVGFQEKKYSLSVVLATLFLRSILFAAFQMVFFLGLKVLGAEGPWEQSARWWLFSVTLTNVVCVGLLHRLLRREGRSFWDFFAFAKGRVVKDYLLMSGLLLASFPIAYLPHIVLGNVLFGDYMQVIDLLYRPLPLWAAWLALIVFPISMSLGELTVYYGYVMPRLEIITKNRRHNMA